LVSRLSTASASLCVLNTAHIGYLVRWDSKVFSSTSHTMSPSVVQLACVLWARPLNTAGGPASPASSMTQTVWSRCSLLVNCPATSRITPWSRSRQPSSSSFVLFSSPSASKSSCLFSSSNFLCFARLACFC
jgi:hypothetical protein